MKKGVLWFILGGLSIWQVYESFKRCGSIDGGALLIPFAILLYYMGRECVNDIRTVFCEAFKKEKSDYAGPIS